MLLKEGQLLTAAHEMGQFDSSIAGPDEVEVPGSSMRTDVGK